LIEECYNPACSTDFASRRVFLDWISVKQAADYTGYTTAHIRLLLRTNQIKGRKFGRDWFTTYEALDEYLATNPRPGPEPKHPRI
jgi:excisionase family DNA binding protein